jgi:glycine cleavage system protein P-like pyridoxal-binding family
MGRAGIVRMSLHLLSGRMKAKGVLQMIHLLRIFLAWRSGMSAVALQPGARIKSEE